MGHDETIRFEGNNLYAALFDVALHTNALLGTIFQMQAQILARLTDADEEKVFESAYGDYEQILKALLVELGAKHGEILIDLSNILTGKPSGNGGDVPPDGRPVPGTPLNN